MSEFESTEFECMTCGKKVQTQKHKDVELNEMLCQQCAMDIQTGGSRLED